jgi:hypothetical protein
MWDPDLGADSPGGSNFLLHPFGGAVEIHG